MPRGQNPEFLEQRFPAAADAPGELAKMPICVRHSTEADRQIRAIPGYASKIRQWVLAGLRGEVEPQTPELQEVIALEDLKKAVDRVLWTIPPKERKSAQKYFKKLLEEVSRGELQ